MTGQQIPNLTGARYGAALAVLVMHLGAFFTPPPWLAPLVQSGGLGVVFFFVLSGFVLTHSYKDAFQSGLSTAQLKAYAVRRLARVYPLYGAVLLLYALVQYNQHGDKSVAFVWVSWWAHALAVQAWLPDMALQQYWNAPGWSISSEFFFYAALPLVLWFFNKRSLGHAVAVLVAGAVVVFCGLYFLATQVLFAAQDGLGAAWVVRFPLLSVVPFLAGVLLGIHSASPARKMVSAALAGQGWSGHWWVPAALIVLCVYALRGRLAPTPYAEVGLVLFVYTPLFVWLTQALACTKNALGGALNHPALVLLGQASYALYIMHWWFMGQMPALVRLTGSPGWAVVLAVAAMTGLSVLAHVWFELPAQRWINRRCRKLGSDSN